MDIPKSDPFLFDVYILAPLPFLNASSNPLTSQYYCYQDRCKSQCECENCISNDILYSTFSHTQINSSTIWK
jgi:hypothetical protein